MIASLGGGLGLAASFGLGYLAARAALYRVRETRPAVILAFAVLVHGSLPVILGRLTQDLGGALALLAICHGIGLSWFWRKGPTIPAAPSTLPRMSWVGWLGGAVIFGLVVATALRGHYFDEILLHDSLIAALAHGGFPLEHPLYPGEPFPYHYGFDVLAAEIHILTGWNVELCIDVVKIGIAGLLLALARMIGAQMTGPAGASSAVVMTLLGSSATVYLLFVGMGQLELRWPWPLSGSWYSTMVPPVVVNFFQHAQGTGMPLALAVLLLALGRDEVDQKSLGRWAAASVATAMLSLFQFVFFGMLGFALGIVALMRLARERDFVRCGARLLLLATAVPLAAAFGGMFEALGREGGNQLVFGRTYFSEPFGKSLLHHVFMFGLPLLLLPFAMIRAGRDPLRWALISATGLGFVVPNLMVYSRSWDIVKFYTVGAFFLNLLAADVLAAAWQQKRILRALAVLGWLASTATGWMWLGRTTVFDGRLGIHRWQEPGVPEIARAVAKRIWPELSAGQWVLSTNVDMSKAGLPTPGFDPARTGGGAYLVNFEHHRKWARILARARQNLAPADLERLRIHWVVLSPVDLKGLTATGRRNLADLSHAFDVQEGGQIRHVYRVP